MKSTITMGQVLEIWEDAFFAGYAAHTQAPWIDAREAFRTWFEEEEAKVLGPSENRPSENGSSH
jgi:hypothetical protein